MAITAQFLRNIMAEARPIIERQMNDAKLIAGFREVVANAGGDWGALKALIKAHVEDENDETGAGKRVKKIVDKADDTAAYADMLGLANMNEKNFSARRSYAQAKGIDVPSFVALTSSGGAYRYDAEITEHEQPETAHETHERPSTNAEASPEAGPQAEASQSQGTGAGTLAGHEGRSEGEAASACLPTNPPSAALPAAEPEAVSPTPPTASDTTPRSSGFQEVPGGNLSKPSPDAGAEDVSAPAERKNAQSEQAAHHFDDDVPAFLKQERAERQPNPKCRKPGDCKWDHGQVSCWRCNSAPAARESEVA